MAKTRAQLDQQPAHDSKAKQENSDKKAKSEKEKPDPFEVAKGWEIELYHTADKEPVADFIHEGKRQTLLVNNKNFNYFLGFKFHQNNLRVTGNALKEVQESYAASAMYEGKEIVLNLRSATHEGKLYIDCTNEQAQVIEVSESGWRVIPYADCPVFFIRSSRCKAMYTPIRGGKGFDLLGNYFPKESVPILAAWLVGALLPGMPCPALIFQAAQGSGKSTLSEMIVALVDPSTNATISLPKEERDLIASIVRANTIAYDNASSIPAWLSDALCRVITGAGYSARKLNTDAEEFSFSGYRKFIINGITQFVTRGDLADRSLSVYLPTIDESNRKSLADLWKDFNNNAPFILAAILDALVEGLQNIDKVDKTGLIRLADWFLFIRAAKSKLPEPGNLEKLIKENRSDANEELFDNDPVAKVLIDFLKEQPKCTWEGVASDLHEKLLFKVSSQGKQIPRGFPKGSSQMSGHINRNEHTFRAGGIAVSRGTGREKKLLTLKFEAK